MIRGMIKAELDDFIEKVKTDYSHLISQVILFGSVARGDCTENSDIDLLILCDRNEAELKSDLTGVATDLLLEYGKYLSVKVYDMNRYQYLRHLETPFIKNILKEGQTLWERKSL